MLTPGSTVTITQSSISLEQLLGKFIFSVGNLGGPKPSGQQPASDNKPPGGPLAPLDAPK
jgi:phospholipid/cholesterol/gamma-HCH transport system substrate-binding protein